MRLLLLVLSWGLIHAQQCENTCDFVADRLCDDGGPGSQFSACSYGQDCADCGARSGLGELSFFINKVENIPNHDTAWLDSSDLYVQVVVTQDHEPNHKTCIRTETKSNTANAHWGVHGTCGCISRDSQVFVQIWDDDDYYNWDNPDDKIYEFTMLARELPGSDYEEIYSWGDSKIFYDAWWGEEACNPPLPPPPPTPPPPRPDPPPTPPPSPPHCPAGTFLDAGICAPCASGTYKDSRSKSSDYDQPCDNCPEATRGYFVRGCGGSERGTQEACTQGTFQPHQEYVDHCTSCADALPACGVGQRRFWYSASYYPGGCRTTNPGECQECHRRYLTTSVAPDDPRASCCFEDVARTRNKETCRVEDHLGLLEYDCQLAQPLVPRNDSSCRIGCIPLPNATCDGPGGTCLHGSRGVAVHYENDHVPSGEPCQPVQVVKVCTGQPKSASGMDHQQGDWSADWSPAGKFERCVESCVGQNGTILKPGQVEERTGYASSIAPLGKTCAEIASTERRTCPLSGRVDAATWHTSWEPIGEQQCHEACPSIGRIHGETADRVRFRERFASPDQGCESEVQRSTCEDGVASAWDDYAFGEAECSVLCASGCLPTMLADGEWDAACVNDRCCLDNGDAYAVLLGRLRAGEYSALRGELVKALEHLGWGCNQSTSGAHLLAPSLRDLSEQACRLGARLRGGFDHFASEELRIPTLGFRKNEAIIEALLSSLQAVEDDLQQVHSDQLVLRQWISREQAESIQREALANATRRIVHRIDERFNRVDAGLSTLEVAIADVRRTLVNLGAELGGLTSQVQRTQSLVLRNGVQLLANGRLISTTSTRVLGAIDSVGIDLVGEITRGNAVVIAEVGGKLQEVARKAVRTIAAGQERLADGQQMLREGQEKLADGIEGVARLVVEVGEEVKEVVRVECGMNRELLYDMRESQLAAAAKTAEEELIKNIETVLRHKMEQIERCDHQFSANIWDGDVDGSLSLRELVTMLGDFGALDPAGTTIFGEFAGLGWSTALNQIQMGVVQRVSSDLYGSLSTSDEMRAHSDLLRCRASTVGCLVVAQSWDVNGDGSLSRSEIVDVLDQFGLMNGAAHTIWDGLRPAFDDGQTLPLPLGFSIINALHPMNSMLDHLIEEALTLIKLVPGFMDTLGSTAFAAATCAATLVVPLLAPMCASSAMTAVSKAVLNGGVILEYGKKIFHFYRSCTGGPCKAAFVNLMWDTAVSARCSLATGIAGLVGEFAHLDRFEVITQDGSTQRTAAGNRLLQLASEAEVQIGEDSELCPGSGGRRRAQATVAPPGFEWPLLTFNETGEFLWDLEGTIARANATLRWADATGGNLSALPSDLFVLPPERARVYKERASARLGSLSGDPAAVAEAFAWSGLMHDTLTTSSYLVGRADTLASRESSVRHVAGNDTSAASCASSHLSIQLPAGLDDVNPAAGLARLSQQEQALVEQQQSIVTTLLREAYTYARQIEYFTLEKSTLLRPVVYSGFNHLRVPNVPGIPKALDTLGTRFSYAFGASVSGDGDEGFLFSARETIRSSAAAKVSTQAGWVRHTITWESARSAFEQLHSTGQISLTLRPDLDSKYFDVRVLRAVAFVLPALGEVDLRVELRKGSDSIFLDAEGTSWAFVHEWASILHSDSFNPSTCTRNYASIENQFNLARDNIASSFGTNVNYPSPFGSWTLEVDDTMRSSIATKIVLEFFVTYRTTINRGTSPYLFEAHSGVSESGPKSTLEPVVCLQTAPPTVPPPPSPFRPSPSPPHPPSAPSPRPRPPLMVPIASPAPTFVVIVSIIAAGDLSEFSDNKLREMAALIADAAGVLPTDVFVTASAASMLIRAEVFVSKAAQGAVAAELSDRLSSQEAATSFFSAVSGGGVAVISVPAVELATQSSAAKASPPPSITDTPEIDKNEAGDQNAIMFVAIGAGSFIILLAMYVGYRRKKRQSIVVSGHKPAISTTTVHIEMQDHSNNTKVDFDTSVQ